MSSSIELPSIHKRCPFCDYLEGVRPYTVLMRNERIAILVTREQRGLPHLLVIPVRHVPTIIDLPDEDAFSLMVGVRQAAKAIIGAYGRPGISIWQNNGVSADQTISHLHFHVAGTLPEGGTERGVVKEISVSETDAIADLLRPVLNLT